MMKRNQNLNQKKPTTGKKLIEKSQTQFAIE